MTVDGGRSTSGGRSEDADPISRPRQSEVDQLRDAYEAELARTRKRRNHYRDVIDAGMACAAEGCTWGCGDALREALDGDCEHGYKAAGGTIACPACEGGYVAQEGQMTPTEPARGKQYDEFIEGLTAKLNAAGVPAMPSWPDAIDWLIDRAATPCPECEHKRVWGDLSSEVLPDV